jgi:membrane-associated phospholipid phosphatase
VPSLHAGFAVAVSAALAAATRRRCWQLLAWLWAPAVCLAVVATGNHFVADIAAGVAITVVGYGVGHVASRRPGRERVERTRRMGFEPAFDLQ